MKALCLLLALISVSALATQGVETSFQLRGDVGVSNKACYPQTDIRDYATDLLEQMGARRCDSAGERRTP